MKPIDLLCAMDVIPEEFVAEAVTGNPSPVRRSLPRRPLLVAAIITTTLLLVGCAVAYTLRLQDMSIGQETYTQVFDENGKYLDTPQEKHQDILTIYGHSGDAIQKAMTEWYDFLKAYDPDGKLMDNIPDHPEIPNQYEYTYSCYTQDMVAKVDEIAAKYQLKLLEERVPLQAWQSCVFLEESGIGSFLRPDSDASVSQVVGMYFPPYNFDFDFTLTTGTLDTEITGSIAYARKDYLPRDTPGGWDLSLYTQWDHIAPDGTKLLLALSENGNAYIIAEKEEAMYIVYLDGNFSPSAYPGEDEILTRRELETLADLFDYTIQPHVSDRATLDDRLAEAEESYQQEHAYVPEVYGSYLDYLKDTFVIPDEGLEYTYLDLDVDGTEELVIGKNGAIDYWLPIHNSTVDAHQYGSIYIVGDGILENYSTSDDGYYETHSYFSIPIDPATGSLLRDDALIIQVRRVGNQWSKKTDWNYYNAIPITEVEAQAILAQYPRMRLDSWKPLANYPLSDSQTLGEYQTSQDIRVSQEELQSIYKDFVSSDSIYSHYRLLDINGDGVLDLLCKGDNAYLGRTDYYWSTLTYRYGQIQILPVSNFYLCEDSVLEICETRYLDDGVEVEIHQFVRLHEFDAETLDFVAYNKAAASWFADALCQVAMVESDVQDILANYPRIDQGMSPIDSLLK